MHKAVTGLAAVVLAAVFVAVPLTGPPSAVAEPVASTSFYVHGSGDDSVTNPCTAIDAPCLTVSGAVTRAHAAIVDGAVDVTVNIAAGTYHENVAIGSVASGHSLSLIGAGAETTTIQGPGTTSVVNITSGVVSIAGLTVTGGESDSGGGIYNFLGELAISDSTVSGNTAAGTTTGGGGGIYNLAGTVTVSRSVVSDNTAEVGYAGGIFNSGILNVADSTLSGNTGWYVGGIHNRGILNVSGSTLSENVATKNFGGGISNFEGSMTLTNSTLSGNSAPNSNLGKGGAIYNKGTATVSNSTLSGNSAYQGGGIWTRSNLLTLTNSTLSANTHTYSRFGENGGGGVFADASPGIKISNSILSDSSCNPISIVVDGGYNVSDENCFWTDGPTSIENSTTIGLAALAANGSTGPLTMAIDETSSAHHLVAAAECATTDQRGMARPGFGEGTNCDAGAYELQAVAPAVTTDPESQTLAIDSDATFTAEASGTPSPTVTWQTYTDDAWSNIADATTTTLTLENVTHAMSGSQYRAVFTNGIGSDVTTAVATLTVPIGALDHLILTPASASTVAGVSQSFAAEGFDAFDNSLGDMTSSTTFTGSEGLDCAAAVCMSNAAGTYTVTGANGSASGTASLTVTPIPEVSLPGTAPSGSGPLLGVPTDSAPGDTFTVTAAGFAPNAPVTFGIYSTPQTLGQAIANAGGTATAVLKIPVGFSGKHTIVAAGMDPSLAPLYLASSVFITAAESGDDSQLVATGLGANINGLGATATLLLGLGSLIGIAALRRRQKEAVR